MFIEVLGTVFLVVMIVNLFHKFMPDYIREIAWCALCVLFIVHFLNPFSVGWVVLWSVILFFRLLMLMAYLKEERTRKTANGATGIAVGLSMNCRNCGGGHWKKADDGGWVCANCGTSADEGEDI